MKAGATVLLGKWEHVDGTLKAGFKMPKGRKAIFMLLGTINDGEDYNPNKLLTALGWTPPKGGNK